MNRRTWMAALAAAGLLAAAGAAGTAWRAPGAHGTPGTPVAGVAGAGAGAGLARAGARVGRDAGAWAAAARAALARAGTGATRLRGPLGRVAARLAAPPSARSAPWDALAAGLVSAGAALGLAGRARRGAADRARALLRRGRAPADVARRTALARDAVRLLAAAEARRHARKKAPGRKNPPTARGARGARGPLGTLRASVSTR